MVAVIVKDDLIRQSLQGLLKRAGVNARFFSKISESTAALMEEPDTLEALIVDYDIDPELCRWLICGISRIACQVKILVYSDFPIMTFSEESLNNTKLIIKEKPFILRDILDILQSDARRKNVSL
jgi:DNA-binding NtrC family response regulator